MYARATITGVRVQHSYTHLELLRVLRDFHTAVPGTSVSSVTLPELLRVLLDGGTIRYGWTFVTIYRVSIRLYPRSAGYGMHSDVMPRQSHSEQETENTGVHVSFVSKEECRVCYAFRLHASSVTHRTRKRKYSCSCFFLFYAKLLFLLQLYCRLVFACFCSVVLFVGLLPHVTCLCMYECSYVVFIDHVLELKYVPFAEVLVRTKQSE